MIFLTALTDTADKVRAFDAGGVDYVTKPFQFEEVLARVKTHVALRRAQADAGRQLPRLRALEQLRDDLVHMVVHDMRSPLQALLHQPPPPEAGRATLSERQAGTSCRHAIQSAEALNQMTNDLLDVSRLEEGQMPIERAVWDLTQMAHDVRAALGAIDRERHIDIDSAGPVEVTLRRRPRPAGHGEPRQQRHQAHARRQPMRISIASGRRPRARRRARRGAPACPRKPERGSSRSSGPSRPGRNRTYHSVGAGPRVLQARHRGPGRDHRRGSGCAGRQHVLVRAAGVMGSTPLEVSY